MRPFRSVLFVPGHKPAWVDKALTAGADAIVLDLEDSVPAELKTRARHQVAESLHHLTQLDERPGVFVRPNALESRHTGQDMEAVAVHGLDGFFCPKIRGPLDVVRYATLIDHAESCNSLAEGRLQMIVPTETVEAIQRCEELPGASPRVGAMIGATARHADVAREVGFTFTPEGLESLYLRSKVLLACRATGVHALTGLWEDVHDLEGLEDFARAGHGLGYRGQIVIHPSHVEVVNRAYSPTKDEIDFYRGLLAAFEDAEREGHGALVYEGRHIDLAHVQTAREWLAQVNELEHMAG